MDEQRISQSPTPKDEDQQWTLAELAEEVGLTGRTVRFYISRGLLAGPDKAGRGAQYGRAHLERLREIQRLQEEGLTLAEIAIRGGEPEPAPLPEAEAWWSYEVADGVEVRVRADQSPWRMRQIRRLLTEFVSHVQETETPSPRDSKKASGKTSTKKEM